MPKKKSKTIYESIRKVTAKPSITFAPTKQKLMNKAIKLDSSEEYGFAADIPDINDASNNYETWSNVEYFDTREEALKFAQETFGADENGCVCLVNNL